MNQTPKWIKLNDGYVDVNFIYEVKLVYVPLFHDFDTYDPEIIILLPNSEIHLEPDIYHIWVKENNLNLPTFEDRL